LVYADANLPGNLLDAVKAAAAADLVVGRDGAAAVDIARLLGERIEPWLKK
jgi:hypothetical protein